MFLERESIERWHCVFVVDVKWCFLRISDKRVNSLLPPFSHFGGECLGGILLVLNISLMIIKLIFNFWFWIVDCTIFVKWIIWLISWIVILNCGLKYFVDLKILKRFRKIKGIHVPLRFNQINEEIGSFKSFFILQYRFSRSISENEQPI